MPTARLAMIISRFNEPVTQRLYDGAMARLKALGFDENQLTIVWVPGAVELPLMAQYYARQEGIDAIICLGAVIRGETGHYDYVCEQVSQGCQRVSLDHNKPVIFGVLTTDNVEQALARAGGSHSDKGAASVDAALEMVALLAA